MRSAFPARVVRILLVILVARALPARADWPPNGLFINALPVAEYAVGPLNTAPDAAGGIFMNIGANIQRISPAGELLLGPDGVNAVGASPSGCVADGAGGFFIVGLAGNTIKLMRFNSAGGILWSSDVCTTGNSKFDLTVRSDNQGGALIGWSEARALPPPEDDLSLYVQRMNGSGTTLWAANGVRVMFTQMVAPMYEHSIGTPAHIIDLCPSGDGGAFMSGSGQTNAYALAYGTSVRFVPAAGNAIVGTAGTANRRLTMIPDGSGGIYVCKYDSPWEVSGQSVELSRTVPNVGTSWTTQLTSVTPKYVVIAPSSDGAVVAWQQGTLGTFDIYAQKVSTAGAPQWTANGVPVCTVDGEQTEPAIATDFAGGAHIVWSDRRDPQKDIYRQHLDANGALSFGESEMLLATRPDTDESRPTLYTDPAGYGIVAWHSNDGNYALRFDFSSVAVAISRFTATARDGRVVLDAEMQSNLDIHSVTIYRATEAGSLQLLHSAGAPDAERFQYEDTRVLPGTRYRYQLVVSDNDGEFSSPIAELTTPALATELKQNHPNPFNPETTIGFSLETAGRTTVNIYAIDGRHVRTLLDENRGVGFHRVTWNGTDDDGRPVGSGVYLYKLSADKYSATRKMLLLK